ncbi:hypothetical protein [Rhodanobacter terrae]|uniref:Uncharacterized protein n=1 Tax=Rhodanobacter terrae TaxID=418647 RepID=A0ABW0STE5_9GAMM
MAVLDIGNGRRIVHRADERFLRCGTFKLLAVATKPAAAPSARPTTSQLSGHHNANRCW